MNRSLFSLYRLYFIALGAMALSAYAQAPGLAIRENGARVDLIFTGTHTIEGADAITGPWTSLGTQSSPFTDPNSDLLVRRFYRINDSGIYSSNAVGYYRIDLCQGWSLIANQLNTFSNTITNVLKSVPDLTEAYKYNPANGNYRYLVFAGGNWYGDHLDLTLHPGEGIWLRAPNAFTHRFLGDVPPNACVPIPAGWSMISCPQPKSGRLDGMPPDGLGFPIGDGDTLYRWDCSGNRWLYRVYAGGSWYGGTPETPIINIGEAFWIYREPANGATQWCRSFSVGP